MTESVPPRVMKQLNTDGILFDLDGVLVDSFAVIARTWSRWAEQHGLDAEQVLALSHGRRGVDLALRGTGAGP